MSSEVIAVIVAAVLSVGVEVIPGLSDLWAKLGGERKKIVVAVLCFGLPFALVGLACVGVDTQTGYYCPQPFTAQLAYDLLFIGGAAFLSAAVTFRFVSAPLSDRKNLTPSAGPAG